MSFYVHRRNRIRTKKLLNSQTFPGFWDYFCNFYRCHRCWLRSATLLAKNISDMTSQNNNKIINWCIVDRLRRQNICFQKNIYKIPWLWSVSPKEKRFPISRFSSLYEHCVRHPYWKNAPINVLYFKTNFCYFLYTT